MRFGRAVLMVVGCLVGHAACVAEEVADYPIRPVAAHHVQFTDSFWQPRLEVNRTVTIPYSFQTCEETGRIENFKVAAGISDKKWTGKFGFNDSDVSKIIEGAAYSLMTHPDPKLAAYVDEVIGYMAAAQEDDGYLYTAWTARDKIDDPANIICCYPKKQKWLEEQDEPRALQPGPHVRGSGGPLRSHRREELSRRGHQERRLAGEDLWPRQDGDAARASRRSSSDW